MENKKQSTIKKYLALFAIVMAASTIFEVPYISYNYYDVLLEATGITNTQMGILMSIFGFISMIGYFPGGVLADKFSARKLISFSLLGMGLVGFYMSTFPSYPMLIVIYVMYGIFTAVSFWTAMLKAVRLLGDSDEQGKLFGLRESGTGLMPILYGMIILYIFNTSGAGILSMRWAIIGYAILTILSAVLAWIFIPDHKPSEDNTEKAAGVKFDDIKKIVKTPNLWLLAIIIFSTISVYDSYSYLTPYLTEFFNVSASLAALLGLIRIYGLALVGGIVSGLIADKIGSNVKVLFFTSIVPVICYTAYLFIPADPSNIGIFIAFMIATGLSLFMLRGVYFAAIDELRIPITYSGSAMGFVSFIGFIPEAFIYTLIGNWMDKYPGIAGYQKIFTYMIVITIIGFISSILLYRNVKKMKASNNEESESDITTVA
ncbi:MAG: MFS transporter [Eubacteriaceae bacterium]|nr:MFS transporter [Eubacteriaceae bacterium]